MIWLHDIWYYMMWLYDMTYDIYIYDVILRYMIWYDTCDIYLLTAIELPPGGSSEAGFVTDV